MCVSPPKVASMARKSVVVGRKVNVARARFREDNLKEEIIFRVNEASDSVAWKPLYKTLMLELNNVLYVPQNVILETSKPEVVLATNYVNSCTVVVIRGHSIVSGKPMLMMAHINDAETTGYDHILPKTVGERMKPGFTVEIHAGAVD